MIKFPVVIIGAGPAGASCAYQLSKFGIDNAILEKESLPRPKVCAGGITARINKLFDFDITCLVHRQVRQILFSYEMKEKFILSWPDPFIYTIERANFDYYLAQKAAEKGTKIYDNTKVEKVEGENIYTNKGVFKAHYVVDAGGASSFLSKKVKLRRRWVKTLQVEVKVPLNILEKYTEKIRADLNLIPLGWAWVFPKKDHLTVGIGCMTRSTKRYQLISLLKSYLDFLFPVYEKIKVASYPISLPSWTNKVAKDNFLLIGEAGNFVDPLSGEGIFWGIKSGKLAANFLKSIIEKKKSCEEFNKITQKEIFYYLRVLFLISAFFYRMPSFFLDWAKKSNRVREYFAKMLQGKLTAERLFNFLPKDNLYSNLTRQGLRDG